MNKFIQDAIVFTIIGLLLGIGISALINPNVLDSIFIKNYAPNQIPNSEQEIIDNCKNLNLTESARCLRDNVELFYFYNITDETYSDFNSLKIYGGNCCHYTDLYIKLAKGLGFESEMRRYDWKENVFYGHRITFMWDDKQVCELDLLKVNCDKRLDDE